MSAEPRHTHTRGERNGQAKLTSAQVRQIRARYARAAAAGQEPEPEQP